MKRAIFASIVTICVGSAPALAQWSKETQNILQTSNRIQSATIGVIAAAPMAGIVIHQLKSNGCYNMIEGSIKGVVQTNAEAFDVNPMDFDYKKINMFLRFPNEKRIRLQVNKENFKANNGILKAYFWEPTGKTTKERRKLAVYLPGIFQGTNQFFTYQATSLLAENGFTVLVIPNSMSDEYLSQRPTNSMGSFEQEAQVVLDAIRSFKAQHSDVTSVDLLGASYGGYLAAVTAAIDAQSKNPVINKQTTLIGPIYSMKVASDYLDPLMDISLPIKATIENEFEQGLTINSFLRNANLISAIGPCKAVGLMFHKSLIQLSMQLKTNHWIDQSENFIHRTYEPISQNAFAKISPYNAEYLEKIRFNSLISALTPENKAYYGSKKDNLAYWLNLAATHNNKRIRIVVGHNDFLSPSSLFRNLPEWSKKSDHLLLTAMGGHNGFIFDSWFRQFVEAAYR